MNGLVKKIFGSIIVLSVLLGLMYGVFRLIKHFFPLENNNKTVLVEPDKQEAEKYKKIATMIGNIQDWEAKDSDFDGLTDSEEKQIGTNYNNSDSDSDGLFDGQEVNIFHTNPLKTDSDGDGVSDWKEVQNGTNPNGQGKLDWSKIYPDKYRPNSSSSLMVTTSSTP